MTEPQTKLIGTQQVLDAPDIPPPDYELLGWEIDETIDCLLDRAVEVGEQHSQAMIAAGRGPAPFAHRACTSYHAIEIIRLLQKELADLQEKYELACQELGSVYGDNS
jgi:hypothetical protein